jgi:hypothetical protein
MLLVIFACVRQRHIREKHFIVKKLHYLRPAHRRDYRQLPIKTRYTNIFIQTHHKFPELYPFVCLILWQSLGDSSVALFL